MPLSSLTLRASLGLTAGDIPATVEPERPSDVPALTAAPTLFSSPVLTCARG